MGDPRKATLDLIEHLLASYLADNCPEAEIYENFDPELDTLRADILDLIDEHKRSASHSPDNQHADADTDNRSIFIVRADFLSGATRYASELYRISAATSDEAERRALLLAQGSTYCDTRIPDCTQRAGNCVPASFRRTT